MRLCLAAAFVILGCRRVWVGDERYEIPDAVVLGG